MFLFYIAEGRIIWSIYGERNFLSLRVLFFQKHTHIPYALHMRFCFFQIAPKLSRRVGPSPSYLPLPFVGPPRNAIFRDFYALWGFRATRDFGLNPDLRFLVAQLCLGGSTPVIGANDTPPLATIFFILFGSSDYPANSKLLFLITHPSF